MNNPSEGNGNSLDKLLYSRQDRPFGRTWEEWTVKWWQWLLSISKDKNPAIDETGEKFDPRQENDNLIFLPGTFDGQSAEREYTIPAGKSLLFPIINFMTSFTEEPKLKTESELVARANEDTETIVNRVAIVDGLKVANIEKYRVQSDVFDLTYPINSVDDLPAGPTKAISDGYWIFLKPLSPGKHKISAAGSCYAGSTRESIVWNLNVK